MSGQDARRQRAKKLNAPRDVTGKWRRKVDAMADRLGWQRSALWSQFEELALMAEFELKLGRPIAEDSGFRLLQGIVDKTELAMECC